MYHQSPVWLAMLRVAPVSPMLEMLSAELVQPAGGPRGEGLRVQQVRGNAVPAAVRGDSVV